jgi:hypothetical protein
MNLPQTIFTLPEQQLNPPDNGSFKEAERFEDKVQAYMSSLDSPDIALAIYENNPINDGCLEILAMAIDHARDGTPIDTDRVKVISEWAKRLFAEEAVERMMGY